MKKVLTLFFILWCSTAWAVEPINLARGFNPYVAGSTGGAAASCSEATNEVGLRDEGTDTRTLAPDIAVCYEATADCTGTLGTGYAYHNNTTAANVKTCVFLKGTNPDTNGTNTKVGCSSSIAGGTSTGWKTSAMDGGSVTGTASYWVCIFVESGGSDFEIKAGDGTYTFWYLTGSGYYASPPANLYNVSFSSSAASAYRNFYVTIK
jgi:hypothetical protein